MAHQSPSFASLATLAAWTEHPAHLSIDADYLTDDQHRRGIEAAYNALHTPSCKIESRSRSSHQRLSASVQEGQPSVGGRGERPTVLTLNPLPAHSAVDTAWRRGIMEEALGSQIATSAVPNSMSFNRVSASSGAGGEVSWDEMGQLGLHKALNEYYKLSASQRNLRLCGQGGAPSLLCQLVHAVLCPQLPAALAPPALFAAAGWVLYAGAWLLYNTAPIIVPLALWLACAKGGQLSLAPSAAAAAARHGALGLRLTAAAVPLPANLQQPAAAALLLAALLLLLRASERAVLGHRRQRQEAAQRRTSAADVQAAYASWAPPPAHSSVEPALAGKAAQRQEQRQARQQQQHPPPSPGLLAVLQGEVQSVWHSVLGTQLPASELQSYDGIGAAVDRLCRETGVELLPPAGSSARGANGSGGSSSSGSPADPGRQLLDAILQIKHGVGLE